MKMKSFAILAISALLAACPYIALAMAGDTSQNQSVQHSNMANNAEDSSVPDRPADNSSVSNNSTLDQDQGGPDTATGDDDDY